MLITFHSETTAIGHNQKLFKPSARTNTRKHFLCHLVVDRWHNLQEEASLAASVAAFKKCLRSLPLHGGDTSWPKQFQNGGPQAIYETLHIEYWIVCCIEKYLIHIYHISKRSKCNWNKYIEGFCIWNVHFHINGLSPNIAYVITCVILMSCPSMDIYFLL